MSRSVQNLRVFVSSPADVQPERVRLEKVVHELNLIRPKEASLHLELVRWETHAHPDFGRDPQAVINDQIGTDYDIFIGILWSRAGTPTSRYLSGTLEEFDAAYNKWQADPASVILMVYFKDEPVAPSELQGDQLVRVQNFKKQLPVSGGLYWSFRTVDEFETQVRLHLLRAIQSWRDRSGRNVSRRDVIATESVSKAVSREQNSADLRPFEKDDELGFLDYMELVQEASDRHAAVLGRLVGAMEQIGTKTQERVADTKAITAQPTVAAARQIFDQSARDFNEFAAAILGEVPQLSQAHTDLLKNLVGAAASSLQVSSSGKEQVEQALTQLDTFTAALRTSRAQMIEFRTTVSGLPRMAVTFNKAKRRVLEALDSLDAVLSEAMRKNTRVHAEIIEVLVLSERADPPDAASRTLRNSVLEYFDPFEPVAPQDWEALR